MENATVNPPVGFSVLFADLSASLSTLDDLNVSLMRTELGAFNTSLWDSNIIASPSLLDSMSALSPGIDNVTTQTSLALAALDLY